MNITGRWAAVAAASLAVACLGGAARASDPRGTIEMRVPDWSGSWSTFFGPLAALTVIEPAVRPEKRVEFHNLIQQYLTGKTNFRDLYCKPYLFGGFSEGAEGDIEFAHSPGEVLLVWEGGLVRRVYTDGRALDSSREIAGAGRSRGRWDGDTLVVETDLNPDAGPIWGYLNSPAVRVGNNARLAERIHLKDSNMLTFDLTLVAPELLVAPVKLQLDYHRDHGYLMSDYTRCAGSDRSLNPASGGIGYDVTPPPDLPPPPQQ